MWHFIAEKRADVYLQRIIDGSTPLRGYQISDLEELAKRGIPALMNTRSYPRINSYEQVTESKPWFTKTGRLEFYRPEIEFIEAGENLAVYREPSDATFYDPCAILAAAHPAIRPKRPADWKISPDDRSHITRQMRNTTYSVEESACLKASAQGQGLRSHLPHAEISPRCAHHADRHRFHGGAVRPVRRHVPARQAYARHR